MLKLIKQLIYTSLLLFFGIFLGIFISYLLVIQKAVSPTTTIDQGNPKVMSDILNQIG